MLGLQLLSSVQTVARSTRLATTTTRSHRGAVRWMSGLPGDRLPKLKHLLEARRQQENSMKALPLRIMETHSGLTGLIAEHAVGSGQSGVTFDGMWSSSLTASAVRGMPDIEAVDTSARLDLVKETLNVTTKPMIYDGDTGGLPEIFKFTVRSLEQLGVSAVIIEDKEGLKQNSLLEDSDHLHQLVDIEQFCHKIKVGLEARRSDDFMIIARMESLIAGRPMEEAVARATACVDAGASGIMIHSRQKSPAEVLEFLTKFRASPGCKHVEVVVVPSSYNHVTEAELGHAGASICIYANQLLRASYPAMMGVAQSILDHSRSYEASADLMGIKEITGFIDHDAQMAPPVAAAPSSKHEAPNVPLRQPLSSKQRKHTNGILDLQTTKKDTENKVVELARASYGTAVAIDYDDDDEEDFVEEKPTAAVEKTEKVCPSELVDFLRSTLGINFFTGVPDSCIKKFCSEVDRQSSSSSSKKERSMVHAIAANEGASVALAVGNHLATGNVPLVYMQNSGLGNAANPVLSAAHPEVYGIPMVMVLGWRGAPGVHDEPQHLVTGRQSEEILKSLEVETFILPKDQKEAEKTLFEAHDFAKANSCPVAVLVEPDTFSGNMPSPEKSVGKMTREEALSHILDTIGPNDAVVATTGFTSRELYELRGLRSESRASDFLCVGNMGHAIAVAQGIAIAQPDRTVWCIDGDGAALMHMGSLAMSSSFGLSNLRHVLINNDAHESVGGQKTAASQVPRSSSRRDDDSSQLCFQDLATSVGYRAIDSVESSADIKEKLVDFAGKNSEGSPRFIEVKISVGTRSDLGRPKNTPIATKESFMKFLQQPSQQ